jgi:hypothetical protein
LRKVKETKEAELFIEDDILFMRAKQDADFDLKATIELVGVRKEIRSTNKMKVLLDTRKMFQVSKESREYGAKKQVTALSSAMAILAGKSLAATLVGNFFIRFNKPDVPTKMFKKEANALKWLSSIKEVNEN